MTFLIANGYLADPEIKSLRFASEETPIETEPGTDYGEPALRALGGNEARRRAILRLVVEASSRHSRILVFCPSVECAHICADDLRGYGIESDVITTRTNSIERIAAIDSFKSREADRRVLFNFRGLDDGVRCPKNKLCRHRTSYDIAGSLFSNDGPSHAGSSCERQQARHHSDYRRHKPPGVCFRSRCVHALGGIMDTAVEALRDADRELFPGALTILALRDSRYHNSAYAISELIDNSIDAGSEEIEMLCKEDRQRVNSRDRWRVAEIAVLDKGTGMDPLTLLNAMKFGGGTRHDTERTIGKYGMGLPTASMSQGKRVDVWTWQDGADSRWHCSLDADAIRDGEREVPVPDQETPIPDEWLRAGSDKLLRSRSGTLVVWGQLDKLTWKTADAVIRNTAQEVGRIHRTFIDADIVRIRAVAFKAHRPEEREVAEFVPNDPLYLMHRSSTPDGWHEKPMFEEWGELREYPVVVDGKEQTIFVRYSIVRAEVLDTGAISKNPGDTPRGRHARHNIGVSVLREDRELVIEDAFLREGGSADNPQNRWWGCQVEFARDCDELFGVDHNKQMVVNFTQAAKTLGRDDRPNQVILDELGLDDDVIYTIVGDIRDQTRAMMQRIRQMFAARRKPTPPTPEGRPPTTEKAAEEAATGADSDAVEAGREQPTQTDKERESLPPGDRERDLAKQYVDDGHTKENARAMAERVVSDGSGYKFASKYLDGSQMFSVRSSQGVLHIYLNTEHAIYDLLDHIEDDAYPELKEGDPLFESIVAIRLLLSAWARMEDQTDAREDRKRIQDTALDWGRHAEKMLTYVREREG